MLYDRDLPKLKMALVMFTFKCTESHSLNVNFVILLLKMKHPVIVCVMISKFIVLFMMFCLGV